MITVAGSYEYGNGLLISIKDGKFVAELGDG